MQRTKTESCTPETVIGILNALFVAFAMATSLWFAWALFAPRTLDGQGSIPEGCGPVQHMMETLGGPGKEPACLKPGVGYPK